jgi:hypothetical protein
LRGRLDSLFPDRIVMTNGRTITCEVLSEASEWVNVRMGSGSAPIRRDRIKSIIRATPEKREKYHRLRTDSDELRKQGEELRTIMDDLKSFSIKDALEYVPKQR